MKVWAVTLDVSTLNNAAFEIVRGHWHAYLLLARTLFLSDLTLSTPIPCCFCYLVLFPGIAVCG